MSKSNMRERAGLWAAGLVAGVMAWLAPAAAQDAPAPPKKVLRYAFRIAETSFDPAKVSDLYSRIITPHIFEGLYGYDHLARPSRIKPLTAAGMPEMSADFRVFTIRIRPGIYFADDPAFKGQRRELVAQDYVYAFKRFADPAVKSPTFGGLEEQGFVGLNAYRRQVLDTREPFDYDREIPGLRALDRYTLRLETEQPRPRLIETLATGDLYAAVAREVVQHYGNQLDGHPVGTGPFVLKQWRRSSFIALERNPGYRERFYDAEPAPGDAEGQALAARFKGRRLPMIDRVEISVIEENQPRWLSFLNGQQNFLERVPEDFIGQALPGGKLAPNLARRGLQASTTLYPEGTFVVFNMKDPVVGGYSAEKVALRRAIALATDVAREIALVRRGRAVPAQSPLVPHTTGFDPAYKAEMSDHDPARAKALLDLYGYVDRDGDGWRDAPDGGPLVLNRATQPDQSSRQLDELWQKSLQAVGLKVVLKPAKWPENLKAMQAGTLQIWALGSLASQPDGQSALQRLYSPSAGGANIAHFKLPAYDALYERLQALPNGPERDALFREAKRIAAVYVPYKYHVHRIYTDLSQPGLVGYRRPLFWQNWWEYMDIEPAAPPR
jgi:ABC-type transport system substrate-binding protein